MAYIEILRFRLKKADNKVLPSQLTPGQARVEKKWWFDPKYLITHVPLPLFVYAQLTYIPSELNVNSVITKPAHDEILAFGPSAVSHQEAYTLQGYAYSGGGRRINRVEVSMDDGEHWVLARVDYPEDSYRAVTHHDPTFGKFDLEERDTSL